MIDLEKEIARRTLKILITKSWNKISIEEVLTKNRKKKNNIRTKIDLLKNINRYVDSLLIKNMKSIDQSSTKDMLFEVLMARFDILQENRISIIKIYESFKKSPHQIFNLLPSFLESMIVTAELAKFNVNGLKGSIRLKGLIVVYFSTFLFWLDDKTASLEKTMTGLDKNLDHAERLVKLL